MLLAGGEAGIPLAAMLFGHPCKVVHAADVHDRRHGALLLVLIRNALRDGLNSHAISLADFKVAGRQFVVGSDCDRQPGTVVAALLSH